MDGWTTWNLVIITNHVAVWCAWRWAHARAVDGCGGKRRRKKIIIMRAKKQKNK